MIQRQLSISPAPLMLDFQMRHLRANLLKATILREKAECSRCLLVTCAGKPCCINTAPVAPASGVRHTGIPGSLSPDARQVRSGPTVAATVMDSHYSNVGALHEDTCGVIVQRSSLWLDQTVSVCAALRGQCVPSEGWDVGGIPWVHGSVITPHLLDSCRSASRHAARPPRSLPRAVPQVRKDVPAVAFGP